VLPSYTSRDFQHVLCSCFCSALSRRLVCIHLSFCLSHAARGPAHASCCVCLASRAAGVVYRSCVLRLSVCLSVCLSSVRLSVRLNLFLIRFWRFRLSLVCVVVVSLSSSSFVPSLLLLCVARCGRRLSGLRDTPRVHYFSSRAPISLPHAPTPGVLQGGRPDAGDLSYLSRQSFITPDGSVPLSADVWGSSYASPVFLFGRPWFCLPSEPLSAFATAAECGPFPAACAAPLRACVPRLFIAKTRIPPPSRLLFQSSCSYVVAKTSSAIKLSSALVPYRSLSSSLHLAALPLLHFVFDFLPRALHSADVS